MEIILIILIVPRIRIVTKVVFSINFMVKISFLILNTIPMPKRKPKLQTPPTSIASSINDVKALQMEVVRLQSQLKHEQLRAEAYDEMINVAETRFNIAIRKKAGAKQ